MPTYGLKIVSGLGSYALDDMHGIIVTDLNDPSTFRINPVSVPRRDGALIDLDLFLEPKIIVVNGIIWASTLELYRTNVDNLKKNLRGSSLKFYKLDDRHVNCQLENIDVRDRRNGRWGDFTFDLIVPDPYWYAESASYEEKTTNQTSYDFTITPTGDAPVYPKITITAGSDFTNPSVQNRSLTNMPLFSHTGTGQAWIIDCALNTATMGGSDSLTLLSGEFWYLLAAANTIRFTQSVGISVTIRVDWTNRWL